MIQVGRIRQGFQYFKGVKAASIVDILKRPGKTITQIPSNELWNCYYTLAHHEEGNRVTSTFISQEVIAFDIDGMNVDDYETYIPIVCDALDVEKDKTGIINSGNGLHFLILVEPITDVLYFKKNKSAYKNTCKIINEALAAANLLGKADEVVFEPTRIFRLPGTQNIKQKNNQQIVKDCFVLQPNLVKQTLDLLKADDVKPTEILTQGEYGTPDEAYILSQCEFLKWIESNPEEVHEPEWYAMLSITAHFRDENETSRRLTDLLDTPSINKTNKEAKIEQAVERSGPRKCDSINQLSNWNGCKSCPHYQKVTSPICLKGPNYISTQEMGFTLKLGRSTIRQYIDLLKFYDLEHSHKSVPSMGKIYIWDKTHFRVTTKPEIRNFSLEHFKPTAKATERTEFYNYVEDSFITGESFLNNKNNEGFINFKNGVLDVSTNELLDHDPSYQFFYCLPFDYDENAVAPTWDKYIKSITLDRDCLQNILHEYMGYIIRGGDYLYHKALILSGSGKNGKSTFIQILRSLVGEDNCSDVSITAISQDKFMVAELHGKLVNFSEEEPPECFKQTGKFKHITGNSMTSAQFKYGQPFQMKNKAKVIITYNEMPYLSDTSTGMKRRLMVVPFNFDLEREHKKVDENLQYKLLKELPGIFNIALKGWERLEKQKGFTHSRFVEDELDELIAVSDPYKAWFKECTVPEKNYKLPVAEIYSSYTNYCNENYNSKPMSRMKFSTSLKRSGFEINVLSFENKSSRCVRDLKLMHFNTESASSRGF